MSRLRLMMLLLGLSVAGNIFALGLGITWLNRQAVPVALVDPAPMELAQRLSRLLPETAGEDLRTRLAGLDGEMTRHLVNYRRALAQAARLLVEEPVDREALAAAITEARADRMAVGDTLTGIFVDTVAGLAPETRRALVQRFVGQR